MPDVPKGKGDVESPRRSRALRRIYFTTAALTFLISVPLWWIGADRGLTHPTLAVDLIGGAVLFACFVGSELYQLQIEVRRGAIAVSLSEFPLVLGLVFLHPVTVGAANLLAALCTYVFLKDNARKMAVNASMVIAEAGVAAAVAGSLPHDWDSTGHYVPVATGVLAGALVSALIVGLMHQVIGSADRLSRVVVRSMGPALFVTMSTLIGLILFAQGALGRVLCIVLGIALVGAYRFYARFLREHAELSRMYDFGRRVAEVGSSVADWEGLIEEVRDQLNAGGATLYLTEPDGRFEVLEAGRPDGAIVRQIPTTDPLLAMAAAQGQARISSERTSDPILLAALKARDAWDVLVVPLRTRDSDRGFLEVRDRRNRYAPFRQYDVQVLGTLGRHIATALDNIRLLDTLRHEAHHNAVTGLLNWRGLIFEAADALVKRTVGAVLLIDLGVLTEVTSAIGHDSGEQLLVAVGKRLVPAVSGNRTVAHLEADRFAVFIESLPEGETEKVVADILAEVDRSYSINGIDVEPQMHAGVAEFASTGDAVDAGELLQRAEMALAAAKASDQMVRFYGASMGEIFRRRFQLVTQFRRAVTDGTIVVHYQPKQSLSDRELVGVEALVRWTHPEYGPVSPTEFIEAIEATGSIDILLEHVLEIVLKQIADWTSRNMRIPVAVNLSTRNLMAANFSENVRASLQKYGVQPSLLTFEITESSVMADPGRSLPILRDLHNMGIGLSVDDFGTGYSSLAYLRRLPIDEIKIDKSFVQGMVTDLGDSAIVRFIIELGHSLDLSVVAEGVEEEAARDALRDLGCDNMQGFLLARPLPIERLEAWFTSRTVRITKVTGQAQVLRLVS